jgi:fatty-acyl-CoA synthase
MGVPAGPPVDLGALIGRRAAAAPRLAAVTSGGRTASYGDLPGQIGRLAAELAAGGAGRDRVA